MSTTLNGRKVRFIRLHVNTHVTGLGNLGPVIDENSTKMKGTLDMTKVDEGVLGIYKNVEFFIPSTNIVSLEFTVEKNEKAL